MASRAVEKVGEAGSNLTVVIATGFYFLLPLVLVLSKAATVARPGGFGRGFASLFDLSIKSILLAVVPSIGAVSIAALCSFTARFNHSFHRFYQSWLVIILFTNPVFLVFGFSVLLASVTPSVAVVIAGGYILLPLVGLVVQAAVDDFPQQQVMIARALGTSAAGVVFRHLLPGIRSRLLLVILLGTVYALGFYLVPAFVGMGRVVTLGTAIDHAANRLGDWVTASQLCVVALVVQSALLLIWMAARKCVGETEW
jgi:ABC-type spermidine/putrescine transport system permease subunit I